MDKKYNVISKNGRGRIVGRNMGHMDAKKYSRLMEFAVSQLRPMSMPKPVYKIAEA